MNTTRLAMLLAAPVMVFGSVAMADGGAGMAPPEQPPVMRGWEPGSGHEGMKRPDRGPDGESAAGKPGERMKKAGQGDRMRELLEEADVDGDGGVTIAEFEAVFVKKANEMFAHLDRNEDGTLSEQDRPGPPRGPRGEPEGGPDGGHHGPGGPEGDAAGDDHRRP